MKSFIFSLCVLAAVVTACFSPTIAEGGPARPPNVILIMTDDQGYGEVAAHGHPVIKTPHLDRLHASSVRLTDFHVDPTCSPTRSALLTGRYSTRTGVWHTINGPDYWGNDYFDDTYKVNGAWRKFDGYCTDVWFEQAIQYIEQQGDKNFFLYLTPNAPHGPYHVPERYATPYEEAGVPKTMAKFYGMITNIDENMGRLRKRLAALGVADNTLLICLDLKNRTGGRWTAFPCGRRYWGMARRCPTARCLPMCSERLSRPNGRTQRP
jgi:arylsulfatase A-like enzyme